MSESPRRLRASAPAAGKVTLWIAFAALVVFALLPQSTRYVQARDGRHRPMRWLQTPIEVQVVAPTPGVGLTADDALQAARQAALGWAAPAVPPIVVTRASVARSAWEDGVSTVTLRDDRWCSLSNPDNCYDPEQVAITHPYSRVIDPRDPVAEIIEADVEVNANHPYFSSASLADKKIRLQAVLTHEFGHLLGLDHNCSATQLSLARDNRGAERPLCSADNPRIREEAMYPALSDPNRSAVLAPTEGERAGAAALYGNGWLATLGVPGSRGLRAVLALVGALLLFAWSARRSRGVRPAVQ